MKSHTTNTRIHIPSTPIKCVYVHLQLIGCRKYTRGISTARDTCMYYKHMCTASYIYKCVVMLYSYAVYTHVCISVNKTVEKQYMKLTEAVTVV